MSFFGQRFHPDYNSGDLKRMFEDSLDAVNFLGLDDETQKSLEKIKMKIITILYQYSDYSKIYKDRILDILETNNTNILEFARLQKVRELLNNNPKAFLSNLLRILNYELSSFWVIDKRYHWIEDIDINIFEKVRELDIQWLNFDSKISEVEKWLWHLWVIIFLEECIKQWKCSDKIEEYAKTQKEKKQNDKTFEYWDYCNLISLVQTKNKLIELNSNENAKAFVLSWWVSNALSQLWYIREFLEYWWKINCISWTSMWAIIAVLVAGALKDWEWERDSDKIGDLIKKIQRKLEEFKLNVFKPKDKEKLIEIFTEIAENYGIEENTKFSELDIPVIVNASRAYDSWEQEILLWWDRKIIDSIKASVNLDWKITEISIDWVSMTDYGANEKWNPIWAVESLWIWDKQMHVIDVWYSSENYKSKWARFSRFFFKWALRRDMLAKMRVAEAWWSVIDIDSKPSKNKWWVLFSKEILNHLVKIWEEAYLLNSNWLKS